MNITVNAHTVKHMHNATFHAVAVKHAAAARVARAKMWPGRVSREGEKEGF